MPGNVFQQPVQHGLSLLFVEPMNIGIKDSRNAKLAEVAVIIFLSCIIGRISG
jgi:hypothetical protein